VQMRPDRVHNDYLNTLTDWGIVGEILVAAAWICLFVGIIKTRKYVQRSPGHLATKKSNRTAFVLGAATGLMAILFHSFVDFNMHIPSNAILATALMALLSGHLRYATDKYWVRTGGLPRLVLVVISLVGLSYLSYQGVRRFREYLWLQKAEPLKEYSPDRLTILKRAFEVEPRNFDTAYQIGESLRVQSWSGNEGYLDLAQQAIQWFEKAIRLQPYDGYSYLRYGMCLHKLGKHQEAVPYFERAEKLDPNGYYMVAHLGWHRLQFEDYAGAKPYFERSLKLQPVDNKIAQSYLNVVNRKLSEQSERK